MRLSDVVSPIGGWGHYKLGRGVVRAEIPTPGHVWEHVRACGNIGDRISGFMTDDPNLVSCPECRFAMKLPLQITLFDGGIT